MKHLKILPASVLFILLTANAHSQVPGAQPVSANAAQPYKIDANNLSIGNMVYTQKVLRAWKDFDNNTLDNSADLFADDIVGTFPDGNVIKGKENFIKSAKDYRSGLSNVESTVDACTTLKSPDHPDVEYVSIWGTEKDTHKDGTVEKMHLNEVWFFNKEGKVIEFHQMAAKDKEESK